jgi:hypothetical protein
MLRNRRTGHNLCCEKSKYLFIQEICSWILPKALHDSSVRQSYFSISCDLNLYGHCCVFLFIGIEVCGRCPAVLNGRWARYRLIVKKESTEIDCFDHSHGFIQIYCIPTTGGPDGYQVSFPGVKSAGRLCMDTAILLPPLCALITCYRATFTFHSGLPCRYASDFKFCFAESHTFVMTRCEILKFSVCLLQYSPTYNDKYFCYFFPPLVHTTSFMSRHYYVICQVLQINNTSEGKIRFGRHRRRRR